MRRTPTGPHATVLHGEKNSKPPASSTKAQRRYKGVSGYNQNVEKLTRAQSRKGHATHQPGNVRAQKGTFTDIDAHAHNNNDNNNSNNSSSLSCR